MLSSTDSMQSTQPSRSSSPQYPGPDYRYSAQNMRNIAVPPRSSTGRAKTEQVVLEFLYKVAELIIQSRVNFHAEPDLRRGSRRARFNLDIEEVPIVRDAMAAWKEDVTLPLAIDIYWDAGSHTILLERWSVTFVADGEHAFAYLSSTQDVIQQLKEVCKRISVLLRALFSFMRQLPAHRLFTQSYPSMLSYTLHGAVASDAVHAFETQRVATSSYSFMPITTPFGNLKVTAVYRRDCDPFTELRELAAPLRILQDDFIIQDYVPSSPEFASASAPVSRSTTVETPTREHEHRTGSFVPVNGPPPTSNYDKDALSSRRSSPRSIPVTTQQPFSHLNHDMDPQREEEVQLPIGMSRPMAIPRSNNKASIAIAANRATLQHAHSYGGEDDTHLLNAAANLNVAAAPYGYGNVAIAREREHTLSPSLAFQHRQQQLWEGHAAHHDTESRLHSSPSCLDEPPIHLLDSSSHGSTAYQCLSTPPRHPKTVALLRTTSPAVTHKPFLETHAAAGSFERFALDSVPPSHVQPHRLHSRKGSFSGAFVSECSTSTGGNESLVLLNEGTTDMSSTAKTETITTYSGSHVHPSTECLPPFTSSPPFQANPCELLSKSPGYAYAKSQLCSGSSTVPMFITTDRFQRSSETAKPVKSATMSTGEHCEFLPDFGHTGVAAWGISPDSPDSLSLALGSTGNSRDEEAAVESRDNFMDDLDALILPFAIHDGQLSAATTAGDSVSSGAGSSFSRLSGASVGNFLQQLKNAPRLSKSLSTLGPSMSPDEADNCIDTRQEMKASFSMFDEELAGFRNLREELTQML
ncbi:hypothetical protein CCR75_000867 [Bremia lactucae]|uniref:Autophagy-related protein 13 N-terminal domain-containing protein n=1 Tax=Bremia lactucae TaxID=4779 RepID=A0A976IFI4_BRELC|nr:hypothetical protein CCR75_000867 [Bremia lactucae]